MRNDVIFTTRRHQHQTHASRLAWVPLVVVIKFLLANKSSDKWTGCSCWRTGHNLVHFRGGLHSQSLDWYWQAKQYRKIHKLNTTQKMQNTAKQNYSGLVASYDTWTGDEIGYSYNAREPTQQDAKSWSRLIFPSVNNVFNCTFSAVSDVTVSQPRVVGFK